MDISDKKINSLTCRFEERALEKEYVEYRWDKVWSYIKILLYFILIIVKKIIQFLFQLSFVKYLPSYMVVHRGHVTD